MSEALKLVEDLHKSVQEIQTTHKEEIEKGRIEFGDIKGKIEKMISEEVTSV